MTGKLFFWANYFIEEPHIGTTTKIKSEINTLRKMGLEVYYTAYLSNGVAIYDNNDKCIIKKKYPFILRKISRFIRKDYLIYIARKYIESHIFDYYYLRLNIINCNYWKMLNSMKKQNAFVMMESLSYYPDMVVSSDSTIGFKLINRSLNRHKNNLKDVVDLMLTEGQFESFYGIPCIELGMGIDTNIYPKHTYKGKFGEYHYVMVGCDSPFHGTDRMIKSVAKYLENGKRNVYVHFVGTPNKKDVKIVQELDLNENVFFTGKKYGEELNQFLENCNIALGPLAQFRLNKMDTGLKTKEYFARGIPYVYSGCEPNIPNGYPYIYNVKDDNTLIDINEINQFYDKISGENVADEMRHLSEEIFSWEAIFNRVFKVVKKLKKGELANVD